MWQNKWTGRKVRVSCDNTNACLAIQTGRSKVDYVQSCIRELFFVTAARDIELTAVHCPGKDLVRAYALSRMHTEQKYIDLVESDTLLMRAERVRVPPHVFRLTFDP